MRRHRSHLAWTLWPITVLFVIVLARSWPALGGASEFAAAAASGWLSLFAWTVVVWVFLGANVAAWRTLRYDEPEGAGPYRSPGCRRLQRAAGAGAWAWMLGHLTLQWYAFLAAGPAALSHYELYRQVLSRPWAVAVSMLGLAALGLYLAQGSAAWLRSMGLGRRPESSPWVEVGCTLLSAMMVLMAVNVLSHFATGRAYWTTSVHHEGTSSRNPPTSTP